MTEESELEMLMERRMAELQTKRAELLAKVPMDYEMMVQLSDMELSQRRNAVELEFYKKKLALKLELLAQELAAEAELYAQEKAAEAELYAQEKAAEAERHKKQAEAETERYEQEMALKAELYAKQKEVEGFVVVAKAMDACLPILLETFRGDHAALREYLTTDGGLFSDFGDIGAVIRSGPPTQERRAGWRGLIYRMLLPLFKTAQVLTGIPPPAWILVCLAISAAAAYGFA